MNRLTTIKLLLAFLLLFGANRTYAQWDFEYQTTIQMTQKPFSNSLIEASPGLFGVTNDRMGEGFWVHWTDINGITKNSQYYVKHGVEMNAHAIEFHNDIIYVTGEIDYGTGLKEMFIMSAKMGGGVIVAATIPYSGLPTGGNDLVKVSTMGNAAEFVAIGYVKFSSVKQLPFLVSFNETLSSITPRLYDFNFPNSAVSYTPTQGKMLDPSTLTDELIIVGNAEGFPHRRVFMMRVNINTFLIPLGHIQYIRNNLDDAHLYNPSVSTSANHILIAATRTTNLGVTDALLYPMDPLGIGGTGDWLYDNGGADEEVIQVHESWSGHAVLAYNNVQGGISTPNVGRIDLSNLSVASNSEYLSVNSPRRMHAAFARSTGSSTMYFACITGSNDATRTIASTTATTPCEFVKDLDMAADPLTTIITSASIFPTQNNSYTYFELDEYLVPGQMVTCDGFANGNFKNEATSVSYVAQEDVLERVGAAAYHITLDEVSSLHLYDLNGKEISSSATQLQGNRIDLSTLPKGMYVLSIQQENKTPIRVKISH